ncbi:MAG: DISARM system SNF2-like helicase DrmD [Planctomycetes bacterium]|nr:DISARM system SNF2-like helicase DrmD [Planctomycetota bacterium]
MSATLEPLRPDAPLPTIGGVVHVRSRQYLVEDVVPPPAPGQSTLVRLSCLADDAMGERLEVLWEHEVDGRVVDPDAAWDRVDGRGFDEPRLFSAFLNTLRWHCVTATDPRLFQAPYRAGIEVKSFQLEPLRKALLMPRVNLFIADDTGAGKTIEAGLVTRELIMRQKVRRIVVCAPPSVVRQWRDEMEQRFGLTFEVYDREFVARARQTRGYSVNPWATHSRFVISHALIRDEEYAAPLRSWLGDFSGGALLILDEAHNVAPASGSKYAIDSHLTRAVRDLAPRFEHRLFLSATPHNGHSNSFAALLEILDPQRFCRGVPVKSPKLLDAVMVRRLKADLREIGQAFPKRHVLAVELKGLLPDTPELVLSKKLQEYRLLRERRLASATRKHRAAAALVIMSLQKRLLSSIEAFARTLAVHRNSVVRAAGQAAEVEPEELPLLAAPADADDARADLDEEEVDAEEDAEMQAASRATGGRADELAPELRLLDGMLEVANAARHRRDPKLEWLIGWIRTELCPDLGRPGAQWNARRVLIFTEYADTKRYLQRQLEAAVAESDRGGERIDTFHGGIGEKRREAIKAAFNADPMKHPLRILIATDAAREGVNLQNHCNELFHFDVPWNPGRMEQRNGRIDRTLQRKGDVYCRYFVLPQRVEDRVLDVLVKKTKTIHEELGSLTPVIARRADRIFEGGIRQEDEERQRGLIDGLDRPERAEAPGEVVIKGELESVRQRRAELTGQLKVLEEMLKEAQAWLGLDVRLFRDALSAALYATAATELRPLDPEMAVREPDAARYVVPALHEGKAEAGWAATLDTLRAPKKKGQSDAEWRRDSPLRPVVFRDPHNLDGEVVHLHLEHRLVRRLLGRFLAQGFVSDDLKRVCIVRTPDPVPKVLVLGRLSLFGDHASRLHDEIITVSADWEDPGQRGRRKLRPLNVGDTREVLRLLNEALATPSLRNVPDAARELLLAGVGRDVRDLRDHLEKRAAAVADSAVAQLAKRGEAEAKEMRRILDEQRNRIDEQSRKAPQLLFDFEGDNDAVRQLKDDQRHWAKRLDELAGEIETEPDRVRRSYEVKARRVEPVGVVYLWPVSR